MKIKCILLAMLLPLYCFPQKTMDLFGALSKSNSLPLSQIASGIEYIPLETSGKCLLSNELQVYLGKRDIFVGDQKEMKFYRFDRKGKLLNTIGQRSDGPQDYPFGLFFYVDEAEESFYVVGTQSQTLYKYAYDGTFRERIPLNAPTWSIAMLNEHIIYYNFGYNRIKGKKNVYELYMADKKGKELQKRPTTVKSEEDDMLLFDFPFFYRYNNRLFYKNAVSDCVYHIDDKLQITPYYKINTGNDKHSRNDHKDIRKYGEKIGVRNVFENDRMALITYVYKNQFEYLVYDKQKEICFNVREDALAGFKDDIAKGPLFKPMQSGASSHNCLLSILGADEITEQRELVKSNPLLAKLTTDDNPVVIVVSLKE